MVKSVLASLGRFRDWILIASFLTAAVGRGQSVDVRNGDVYYRGADGKTTQITSSGEDQDASLSLDKKSIAFIRRTGIAASCEEPSDPHPFERQLLIANVDEPGSLEVVLRGPVTLKNGAAYASFSSPRFASDVRSIYLLIPLGVTEGGLVKVERRTNKVALLSGALSFYVVPEGRYGGDIVAKIRRPFADGMANYFWLLDPDGKELGFVGETDVDAENFLRGSQTLRRAPPSPPK